MGAEPADERPAEGDGEIEDDGPAQRTSSAASSAGPIHWTRPRPANSHQTSPTPLSSRNGRRPANHLAGEPSLEPRARPRRRTTKKIPSVITIPRQNSPNGECARQRTRHGWARFPRTRGRSGGAQQAKADTKRRRRRPRRCAHPRGSGQHLGPHDPRRINPRISSAATGPCCWPHRRRNSKFPPLRPSPATP